jgi:hypothetical protein
VRLKKEYEMDEACSRYWEMRKKFAEKTQEGRKLLGYVSAEDMITLRRILQS